MSSFQGWKCLISSLDILEAIDPAVHLGDDDDQGLLLHEGEGLKGAKYASLQIVYLAMKVLLAPSPKLKSLVEGGFFWSKSKSHTWTLRASIFHMQILQGYLA